MSIYKDVLKPLCPKWKFHTLHEYLNSISTVSYAVVTLSLAASQVHYFRLLPQQQKIVIYKC